MVATFGSLDLTDFVGEPSTGDLGDTEDAESLRNASPVRLANDLVGCAKCGDCLTVLPLGVDGLSAETFVDSL